jgi:hypothetical protein
MFHVKQRKSGEMDGLFHVKQNNEMNEEMVLCLFLLSNAKLPKDHIQDILDVDPAQ